MFDKQRESLAASKNYQKVKLHLQENKRTYLVGAGCFAAGAVFRKSPEVKQTVDAFKIQYKSPTSNVVTTVLERRGHPGFRIRNNKTGEIAASIRRMAETDRVARSAIMKDLAEGLGQYTNLGEMR